MITSTERRSHSRQKAGAMLAVAGLVSALLLTTTAVTTVLASTSADTGVKNATATHSPSDWGNPGNALVGTAGVATGGSGSSDDQQGYASFSFGSLPAASMIVGIQVLVDAASSDSSGCEVGAELSWNNGSSWTGQQTQSITSTSLATKTFGGSSGNGNDSATFGRAWSPSDLSNATFVVRFEAIDPGSSCSGSASYSFDNVKAQVFYRTVSGGTANANLEPGQVCNQADFNFVVDTSGSISGSELTALKAGINSFVTTYEGGSSGSGLYSLTRYSGSSAPLATALTAGFVGAATFQSAVTGIPGTGGNTPTGAGIRTGTSNGANDRLGVPNVMFVVTDGSPNVVQGPPISSPSLSNPATWMDASDDAINAANSARVAGYVVQAMYVGAPDDLPGLNASEDSAFATAVMSNIGAFHQVSDFSTIASSLLDTLGCRQITITKVTDAHQAGATFGGSVSNALNAGGAAAWQVTSPAAAGSTRVSTSLFVPKNRSHVVTETSIPAQWGLVGFTIVAATDLCPLTPNSYSGTSATVPSGTGPVQVCVFNSFLAAPSLSITKGVSLTNGSGYGSSVVTNPGTTVYYRVVVTNTGNVPLTGVTLADNVVPGLGGCSVPSSLAVGAFFTCDYSIAAPVGTTVNTATADSAQTDPSQAQATVNAAAQPGLSITKGVSLTNGSGYGSSVVTNPGTTVYYRVVVTNTGNVPLTGVTLADNVVPGLGGCSVPSSLAVGAFFTCDYSIAAPVGTTVNTATADSAQTDPSQAQATVNAAAQPGLSITKGVSLTNGSGYAEAIDANPNVTVYYRVVVTNTGNVPLTGVTLADNLDPTLGGCSVPSSLAVGAFFTCDYPGTAPLVGDKVNVATADSDQTDPSWDSATVHVAPAPGVNISKSVNPPVVQSVVTTPVTYTITVSNTGTGPSTDVVVTDNAFPAFFSQTGITCTLNPGAVDVPCAYGDLIGSGIDAGPLAVGASFTIVVTGTATPQFVADDGPHTNTAMACEEEQPAPDQNPDVAPDAALLQVGDCHSDDATLTVFSIHSPTPSPEPTPSITVIPTPTPTASPTPTPTGSVEAATSRPHITPPPTSSSSGSTGGPGGTLAIVLGLLAVGAFGLLAFSPRRIRTRR